MSTQVELSKGTVQFIEYHQPALSSGDYEITVLQSVTIKGANVGDFKAARNFTVAGERFELKPTDVESVFPPDGNLGEHSNVLPHIILNRSTLPWERAPEMRAGRTAQKGTGVPWLALLIFDEEDKPKPQTVKASDLVRPPDLPKFPAIKLENAQSESDQVTVIDIPSNRLQPMMPTAEELKLLAHVRYGTNAQNEVTGDERAIIIAKRLPQPGKTSTAHLVSVEGRYRKGADKTQPDKYAFDYDGATANQLIRLISLKSWSFACADPSKSFKQLLLDLNKAAGGPGTLRLPDGNAREAKSLLSRGYVLMPHFFRQGDQTASWFHGPLIPGVSKSPDVKLPAPSADALVRYDHALAMFDISYAAAWELGRLLALQDKDFSTSLYQWKRQYAQRLAQDRQRIDQRMLHLPFHRETPTGVPKDIALWFESLRRLEGVPFNYLAPDERMLPLESIRFFRVDQEWVDCLADGAFSIGRVAKSDLEADESHGLKSPPAADDGTRTGFLLRSEIVSGWPGLLVDGFPERNGGRRLDVVRIERLAAGVLLCIFKGEVARVEIHQQPETLHFGLDTKTDGGFSKDLRDANGKALKDKTVDLASHWRTDFPRTLNIVTFADAMKKALDFSDPVTSAQFGLQMVEGVERIIFVAAPKP